MMYTKPTSHNSFPKFFIPSKYLFLNGLNPRELIELSNDGVNLREVAVGSSIIEGLPCSSNSSIRDINTDFAIISFRKINPTLWVIRVNTIKLFLLSFVEAFDPLWEARIYKDGKPVEKVKSIPLYGVINGFWINETGNLQITIRYTPQDWFEIGLAISATTFILCIFYLFYDWRREKGDRWAKRIERKFRRFFIL